VAVVLGSENRPIPLQLALRDDGGRKLPVLVGYGGAGRLVAANLEHGVGNCFHRFWLFM